jgi:hypothetical protein
LEIEDNTPFSESLTPVPKARYPASLEEILQAVRKLL